MDISYADLKAPKELERRVLASKDFNSLRKWILVQVIRQLAEADMRPLNWCNNVEVSIDFDRDLRERMCREALTYVHVRTLLQEIFVDWRVEFAESPVGRLPFNFRLKAEFCPSTTIPELPTADPRTADARLTRQEALEELRICSAHA